MPILIVLSVFTVSLAIGACARRSRIPDEYRFVVDVRAFFRSIDLFKSTDTKIDRLLSIILIISIALVISVTVYVITVPKEGETFTGFYVLGPEGKTDDYLTNLTVGEEREVIIGVVNHEYVNNSYQLEVKLSGEVIDKKSVVLIHNETWENPYTFRATRAGEDQKLEFLLYKNTFNKILYEKEDDEEPYRSLQLWVDVK